MTPTTKSLSYAFAEAWLKVLGYTYSEDVKRLAERIEECCHDYVADIENGPQA